MSDEKPYDLEFVNNEIPQSPKSSFRNDTLHVCQSSTCVRLSVAEIKIFKNEND